jgi:hypothetical protein
MVHRIATLAMNPMISRMMPKMIKSSYLLWWPRHG